MPGWRQHMGTTVTYNHIEVEGPTHSESGYVSLEHELRSIVTTLESRGIYECAHVE